MTSISRRPLKWINSIAGVASKPDCHEVNFIDLHLSAAIGAELRIGRNGVLELFNSLFKSFKEHQPLPKQLSVLPNKRTDRSYRNRSNDFFPIGKNQINHTEFLSVWLQAWLGVMIQSGRFITSNLILNQEQCA